MQNYWYIVFAVLSIVGIVLNSIVSFKTVNAKRHAGSSSVGSAVVPILNIITLVIVKHKIKAHEKVTNMEFEF